MPSAKLHIVVGQSGASGKLYFADLPTEWKDGGSTKEVTDSTNYAYIYVAGTGWEVMEPTVNTSFHDADSRWGPETVLGWQSVDASEDLYVVKVSKTGAPLGDKVGRDDFGPTSGELRTDLTTYVQAAWDLLVGSGFDNIITTIGFNQGQAEASSANSPELMTEWDTNFAAIKSAVEAIVGSCVWYCVRISEDLPSSPYTQITEVRAKQSTAYGLHSNIVIIDENSFPDTAFQDQIHYTADGMRYYWSARVSTSGVMVSRTFELTLSAPHFVGDMDAQLVAGDVAAGPVSLVGRAAWAFDTTEEEAIVSGEFEFPDAYAGTGTLKATVYWCAASATSGGVVWDVFVESVTPADTLDMEAASGWDSANSGTGTASGTAGDLFATTITLTNSDSIVSGDLVRIGLRRDCDSVSDTMTGDAYVFAVAIFEET